MPSCAALASSAFRRYFIEVRSSRCHTQRTNLLARSPVCGRASKKPIAEGGWSIFGTGWTGVETLDPSANLPLAANGGTAWFGWPSDDKLEQLRSKWLKTDASEAHQEIAVKIQERAFATLPYVPTGQWSPVTAYRKKSGASSLARPCLCGSREDLA
jgi:ABC-type transport system substrate-binding protein